MKDGKIESGSSCLLASLTNLILASILFCNSILSFFLSAAFVLLFDLVILIKVLQFGQVLLLNDVIYFVSVFFLNKFENDVYLFQKLFGFVWRVSNFSLPAKKNNKARVTVKGLWGIFWQFWHIIQRTFCQFGIKEQKEEFHHRTKSSSVITMKILWIEIRFIQTQIYQPSVHLHSDMN